MLLAERMFSGCGKDRVVAMLRRVRFLYAIAPVTDDAGSAAEERSGLYTGRNNFSATAARNSVRQRMPIGNHAR